MEIRNHPNFKMGEDEDQHLQNGQGGKLVIRKTEVKAAVRQHSTPLHLGVFDF